MGLQGFTTSRLATWWAFLRWAILNAGDYLCSGETGAGSALLLEDGEEGAEPAVAMKESGADGARRELNWVLISLTREGMDEEEEEGGGGEVGERANTGTAMRETRSEQEKC